MRKLILVPGRTILLINFYALSFLALFSITKLGQPVKIPVSLSGTFAELRSDHFHGGIDIKGVVGTPVYAVEDGFLHKLESKGTGYGNVIYIKHKNGYMSVYGHLSTFNTPFEEHYYKEAKKYKKSNFSVYFKKNEILVKKGDKIGEIGNTGFSFGAHLHYEIRDLKHNKLVNPLFFNANVKDCSPPEWTALKLINVDENRVSRSERFVKLNKNEYFKLDTLEILVGKTALAAQVFDGMEGNNNRNGVYQLKMYIDGNLHFHFLAGKIALEESKYANALIDYKENKISKDIFYRCYRLPGNNLKSFKHLKNDGYFNVKYGKITNIEVEALDYAGNYSRKRIAIRGIKGYLPSLPSHNKYVYRNVDNQLKTYFIEVNIPKGAVYQNIPFMYREINEICRETFSRIHSVHNDNEPLHKDIFLSIRSGIIPDYLREKAFISGCNQQGKYVNYGGKWRKNFLEGQVDQFGEFSIMIDTIPPTIIDLSLAGRGKKGILQFHLSDNVDLPESTDYPFFKVTLNGQWIRMRSDSKSGIISGHLPVDLKKGKYEIKVTGWDKMNNINHFTKSFTVWK